MKLLLKLSVQGNVSGFKMTCNVLKKRLVIKFLGTVFICSYVLHSHNAVLFMQQNACLSSSYVKICIIITASYVLIKCCSINLLCCKHPDDKLSYFRATFNPEPSC